MKIKLILTAKSLRLLTQSVVYQKVQKHFENLEQQDIIEDITSEATPWLSQLVIVTKSNGNVILCINLRNVNTAIETTFPL